MDAELRAWRERRLEQAAYPYLFVDARYEKVRVGHRMVSQGVLIVSAVRDEGFREIVGVQVAHTESEATYQDLLRSLKARGLKGVELVVSDDHEGLKAAGSRHFQGASWQRCLLSTTRGTSSAWWGPRVAKNWRRTGGGLAGSLRREEQRAGPRDSVQGRQAVARGGAREGRRERAHRRARRGVPLMPGVPREPPQAHPHYERPGEAQSEEIKRRTRVVVRIFPNREACLRLVSALALEQSEEWVTGRRYLDMGELEEQRREDRQAEGAIRVEC